MIKDNVTWLSTSISNIFLFLLFGVNRGAGGVNRGAGGVNRGDGLSDFKFYLIIKIFVLFVCVFHI